MLILSPLRDGHHQLKEEKQLGGGGRDEGEVEGFDFNGGNSVGSAGLDFPDFSGGMGNLLDSIDFDDLFIGIHDGDVLPDLEMDSEILDFSAHRDHGDEYYHNNAKTTLSKVEDQEEEEEEEEEGKDLDLVRAAADSLTTATTTRNNQNYSSSSNTSTTTTSATQDQDRDGGHEEIGSKGDSNSNINNNISQIRASQHEQNQLLNQSSSPKESADQKLARKSSSTAQSKNSHGKRKVKVDWTPELHRRFVQAVEQLGVDKAVPSRILELMGIDCLTRHNIASHLQKYRSHRKHLLAREAEAASWTQRRQIYGAAAVSGGGGGGGGGKSSRSDVMMMNSPNWLNAPTMGFPPIPSPTPPPMHHHHHHQMIRPLHVWGHPSMDQSMMHMWPKHLPHNFPSPIPPPPPPAHAWPPPPPLSDASYWHHPPPHHQRVPNALTPGTPCFPRQLAATTTQQRFPAPPVPGIAPHAVYKVDPGIAVPSPQSGPHPLVDFHPSNESIDAAIGDVLSKPWLPLPLGLRPPATDSVMVELQRQGIPKIPPSCA